MKTYANKATHIESLLDEFFHACENYRTSDKFLEAMMFVAKFRDYAPLNAFLIYTQRPTSTFVASANKWKRRFRRFVKPDARPVVILAPMSPVAFVYDYEDTFGRAIPEYYMNPYEVDGHLDQEKWDNTLNHCIEKDKFKVLYTEKSFLNAACVSRRYGDQFIIEINRNFEDNERKYSSLVHEIAHVYSGHLGDDFRKKKRWDGRIHLTRNQREIEAESVAFLVCCRTGLETRSIEYVAGYLRDPEEDLKQISVKTILNVTQLIENMGKIDYSRESQKKSE